MASRSSRSRLSEAERAERRQRDRERLKQAAEQLLRSEGWQRWVRVRSQAGLRRLSLSNQLLVAMACPEATFVAGFKAWLRLGYAVRKGERAITIIAPLPVKERDWLSGEETGETRLLFKTVFVFDTSARPTHCQAPSRCRLTLRASPSMVTPTRTCSPRLSGSPVSSATA